MTFFLPLDLHYAGERQLALFRNSYAYRGLFCRPSQTRPHSVRYPLLLRLSSNGL